MNFLMLNGLGALDHSKFLPFAQTLYSLVKAQMDRGIVGPADACKFADTQLDPRQGIYEVEINHASLMLEDTYPNTTNAVWIIYLKNAMGRRIVAPTACGIGYVLDPISRTCVVPQQPPIPEPPLPPPPLPDHTAASLLGGKWIYLGLAVIVLLVLKGR